MSITGIPDLLSAGRTARTLAQVQTDFTRASEELTTGRQSDVVAATGGDPIRLYAVERDLALNAGRALNVDMAISRAAVTQTALTRVEGAAGAVGAKLLAAVTIGDLTGAQLEANRARDAFEEAVSALNSRFGDRSLFSGAATDSPAIASAAAMLSDIAARAAPSQTADEVIAAVDDYFTDPAGFAATGYLGSTTDASSAEISPGQYVDYAIRADRDEIVTALKALALGVLGAEGGFAGATTSTRLAVMGEAGQRGLTASAGIVTLRGEVGVAEERLETAKIRGSAERTFLQTARNNIVARDPFEAATEFNALEQQLQTIFEVTARLSQLSLTNFLR